MAGAQWDPSCGAGVVIRHYTLPPDQAARALEAGGPLKDLAADPARLKDMSVAVVEVDGWIIAYWVVWYALHIEPLWVAEAHRKNPAVIKGIVEQMQAIVLATNEKAGFCVIEDTATAEVVASYADRLGFHEAPGKLYYLVLEPAPAPVEV